MKKSCRYCGKYHDVGVVCSKKPVKKDRGNRHRSEAGDLRRKYAWTQKSLDIRERDKYLCRYCLAQGRIQTQNLSVHHIIPINEDKNLWLDDSNLITLCDSCHDKAERKEISRNELKELAGTSPQIGAAAFRQVYPRGVAGDF